MSSQEKAEGLPSASSCDGIALNGDSNGIRTSSYISIMQVRACPLVIPSVGEIWYKNHLEDRCLLFGSQHGNYSVRSLMLAARPSTGDL